MKFDFDKYIGCYVMWCKTEEEAKDFCNLMIENGMKWKRCYPYNDTQWGVHKDKTCYNFNNGTYGNKDFYSERYYTILKWRDYMNKEEDFNIDSIKEGMVVEFRNGKMAIFLNGKFLLEGNAGFLKKSYYSSPIRSKEIDIMKVYRSNANVLYLYFDKRYLELVWEKKEIVEMTMEQIRKALEIKGELKIIE